MDSSSVVLDVQGVGYKVMAPLSVLSGLPDIGEKMTLYTTMSVSPNTMEFTLYGFNTLSEQQVFTLLTSVNGVGSKVGLSMLSEYVSSDLARIISTNDIKSLTKIPGVGPKLAQRIVLEIGEKIAEFIFSERISQGNKAPNSADKGMLADVIDTLVNLGYSRIDAKKTAERAIATSTEEKDMSGLIRDCLAVLSGTTKS